MNAEGNIEILNSVCEICGAKYFCNARDIENCFCKKINLSKEIIVQIKNKYSRCLCKGCLNKFAALGKS